MNERRKFLENMSKGAAGLVASAVTGGAFASAMSGMPSTRSKPGMSQPVKLHGPGQLPEAEVQTSDGKKARLYADLIKGKVVLINYMAIGNESALPITATLLQIAQRLGPKLGSEIHIISITSDPAHDTPARLRAFADKMGIPKRGWQFVRMSDESSTIVAARLHRHPMKPEPRSRIGTISYGNEPVGLWGLFPMHIESDDAMLRITSIMPGKPHAGIPRRAGPRKLGEQGAAFNSRIG